MSLVALSSNGRTADFESVNAGSTPAGAAIPKPKLRAHRLMRGQVAGVVGLVLAGVPYLDALRIMGTTFQTMSAFLPHDWRAKQHRTAAQRAALKHAYETDTRPIKAIAWAHGMSVFAVYAAARAGDWERAANATAYRPPVTAERMVLIRRDYESDASRRAVIAGRHRIARITLDRFAREGGWTRAPGALTNRKRPPHV